MLISYAFAMDNSTVGTGSPGGGIAVLIILGSGILLYVLYSAGKRWRRHKPGRDSSNR